MFNYNYRRILVVIITIWLSAIFLESCSNVNFLNQGKPHFVDFFFTDENGNKIDSYYAASKNDNYIYLVIITENAIGKEVTLEIDDNDPGFIYDNQYINGKVRFKIEQDEQQLKLYIFDYKNKLHRQLKEKALLE